MAASIFFSSKQFELRKNLHTGKVYTCLGVTIEGHLALLIKAGDAAIFKIPNHLHFIHLSLPLTIKTQEHENIQHFTFKTCLLPACVKCHFTFCTTSSIALRLLRKLSNR